jgi:hypothetical protein
MGKYPKILSVLTLVFFVAQASALDIWGGSNNAIASWTTGASATGGLIIGPNTNELNYDLFSYSQVPAGSTGFALFTVEIPNNQSQLDHLKSVDSISHESPSSTEDCADRRREGFCAVDPADPDGEVLCKPM